MSDHEKETAFLRHCLRFDDSPDHHKLDESISEIQRDERCVFRAVWLMALLTGLAMAGFFYAAVLVDGVSQLIAKSTAALGLASLSCLVVFVGLKRIYRMKLDQRREECRQLVMKLMESQLGNRGTRRETGGGGGNREAVKVAERVNSLHRTELSIAQG